MTPAERARLLAGGDEVSAANLMRHLEEAVSEALAEQAQAHIDELREQFDAFLEHASKYNGQHDELMRLCRAQDEQLVTQSGVLAQQHRVIEEQREIISRLSRVSMHWDPRAAQA